ncbi:MAG: hypothetical protein FJ104_06830, partial [Deltaproteobacteria bacterium]|nr:hypothetical protein [Deltaproteobacteria bacterium]
AAQSGRFFVYTVGTADEAIEILTGVPAGTPDADGEFPAGSIGGLVEQQLVGFAIVSKRFGEFVQVDGESEGESARPARRARKRRRGSH